MLLDEVLVVLGDGDVEPAVRDDPAAVDRVLVRVGERDELVVAARSRGSRSPTTSRTVSSAISRARSSGSTSAASSRLRRGAVEAADAHVDRMDLAAADDAHQLVAGLLQLRAPRSTISGCVAGELDRARVAEEVGRVQHVDVQRVALDPLAAVEQPAQRAELARRPRRRRRPPSRARRSSGRRPGRCRRSAR